MDSDSSKTTTVSNHLRRYHVESGRIHRLAREICSRLGVAELELNIEFVGERRIQTLNQSFRGKDKSTDVLSFPQKEWPKPLKVKPLKASARAAKRRVAPEALGDIVISLPNAERNARHIGHALDREVCFLLVHGILHLCGHDHMTPSEERTMLKEQRTLMTALSEPAPLWKGCARLKK